MKNSVARASQWRGACRSEQETCPQGLIGLGREVIFSSEYKETSLKDLKQRCDRIIFLNICRIDYRGEKWGKGRQVGVLLQ